MLLGAVSDGVPPDILGVSEPNRIDLLSRESPTIDELCCEYPSLVTESDCCKIESSFGTKFS